MYVVQYSQYTVVIILTAKKDKNVKKVFRG